MLIETDIILAHVKEEDWLKPYAEAILREAERGGIELYASCQSLHELYYIAVKLGIDLETLLDKIAALTAMENVKWTPATTEIVLTAVTLMLEYNLGSIFDAYYAATALLSDPDRTIISTDIIYEKVPGIKKKDPREFAQPI